MSYIKLKKKGSGDNGFLCLHGGDRYWYSGTEKQAFCFSDTAEVMREFRGELDNYNKLVFTNNGVAEVITNESVETSSYHPH